MFSLCYEFIHFPPERPQSKRHESFGQGQRNNVSQVGATTSTLVAVKGISNTVHHPTALTKRLPCNLEEMDGMQP